MRIADCGLGRASPRAPQSAFRVPQCVRSLAEERYIGAVALRALWALATRLEDLATRSALEHKRFDRQLHRVARLLLGHRNRRAVHAVRRLAAPTKQLAPETHWGCPAQSG